MLFTLNNPNHGTPHQYDAEIPEQFGEVFFVHHMPSYLELHELLTRKGPRVESGLSSCLSAYRILRQDSPRKTHNLSCSLSVIST